MEHDERRRASATTALCLTVTAIDLLGNVANDERRAMANREVPVCSLPSRAFPFSRAKPNRRARGAGQGGRVR